MSNALNRRSCSFLPFPENSWHRPFIIPTGRQGSPTVISENSHSYGLSVLLVLRSDSGHLPAARQFHRIYAGALSFVRQAPCSDLSEEAAGKAQIETTSTLDLEIDWAIGNLCQGKTVIVVAHCLSALKLCDQVAVLENHTITCVGTSLIRLSFIFYNPKSGFIRT